MNFITFGEIMMRLTPPEYQEIEKTNSFDVHYGGSEENVAVNLSGFGINTELVTGLPSNALGEAAIKNLIENQVGTNFVKQKNGRIGTYFLEKGFGFRNSKVIYDRKHSVFSKLDVEEIDWEKVFENQHWFHFSGITPALSEETYKLTLEACKVAKKNGLLVSCDLNYRANLWSFETARLEMSKLLPYVDLIFGYEPISLRDEDGKDKKDGLDRLIEIEKLTPYLKEIHETYDIDYIAFTQRKNFTSSRNRLQGFLSVKGKIVQSQQFTSDILDRVGTGDAFSSGIIYGLMKNWDDQEIVRFAINNMLYKHAIHGDNHQVSVETIKNLTHNDKDIKR